MKRLISIVFFVLWLAPAYGQTAPPHHGRKRTDESVTTTATQPAVRKEADKPEKKDSGKPEPAAEGIVEKASITDHEVKTRTGPLKYTATAANMLMKDEEGKTKARVFFVAYEKQHAADADLSARPVTFVFNGGPGAAAVWLHLGTAGPQRVRLNPDGDVPPPPYKLVENAYTWLDATDLVFIDPVGTGFSRAEKGEKAEQFYGVREDITWVADFIRLWMTQYRRWLSPLFLAGESYGTTRAAGLSEYLLDHNGIALNGIILISSVLDFSTLSPGEGNDVPYALYLPSYAAIAWYHKRLAPELQASLERTLQEAEQWAAGPYLVALARGSALSPGARRTVVQQLARFTSLPPDFIERANLRIGPGVFQKQLLAGQGRLIGRFDARITGFDPEPISSRPTYDPALSRYLPLYTSTFNDYVRRVLKYESSLPYEVLSGKVHPWKYGTEGQGYLNVADNLASAMIKNPNLRVLFCSGYFDLATPYYATIYTVDHLDLSQELRTHIRQARFSGGHMMYHYAPSLEKLHNDIADFLRWAVPRAGEPVVRPGEAVPPHPSAAPPLPAPTTRPALTTRAEMPVKPPLPAPKSPSALPPSEPPPPPIPPEERE